jgi:hypothetical protein
MLLLLLLLLLLYFEFSEKVSLSFSQLLAQSVRCPFELDFNKQPLIYINLTR